MWNCVKCVSFALEAISAQAGLSRCCRLTNQLPKDFSNYRKSYSPLMIQEIKMDGHVIHQLLPFSWQDLLLSQLSTIQNWNLCHYASLHNRHLHTPSCILHRNSFTKYAADSILTLRIPSWARDQLLLLHFVGRMVFAAQLGGWRQALQRT